MFPKEIAAPSVSVDPVVWHQYATMRNGGLATKTTEISVLQSGGIPTLPASLGTSSVLNNTAASEIDGSQSAVGAEVEKPGTATMSPNTSSRTSWKKTRSQSAKPQEDAPPRAVHAVTSLENCIFFCSLSLFLKAPISSSFLPDVQIMFTVVTTASGTSYNQNVAMLLCKKRKERGKKTNSY